jgi:hypothetical protein
MGSSALAADPIVQNRDEVGRHPYYAAVTGAAACIDSFACQLRFPAVDINKRAVIQVISCALRTGGDKGVAVSLSAASTPQIRAFFAPATLPSLQSPLDAATLVFVNGGDEPLVSITTADALTLAPYCYLAGSTVTLP